MDIENHLPVVKPQSSLQKASEKRIWTSTEKTSLALAIGRVFDLQKQYGKTAEQLKTVIEGFCWALQGSDPEKVIAALQVYILNHSDMPTPYDIRAIIDPIPEGFKPDKAYYIKLQELVKNSNFSPYALNDEEKEYIRKYEEHMQIQRKNSER